MKKILFAAIFMIAIGAQAQDKEKTPAAKGVVYGVVSEENNPATTDELKTKLVDDKYQGQVKGKVVEVCKAEGCWIRLERKDGTNMMVRVKNHAFLMPENIVGKTVLIEGTAVVKTETESMRRHYAEDSGKPKEEIEKIKGDLKDIQFSASGVKVLD